MSVHHLSEAAQRCLDEVLRLPENDRSAIYEALRAVMPEEGEQEPDKEFLAEVLRRRDRYLRGESKGVTWEEIQERIRARARI